MCVCCFCFFACRTGLIGQHNLTNWTARSEESRLIAAYRKLCFAVCTDSTPDVSIPTGGGKVSDIVYTHQTSCYHQTPPRRRARQDCSINEKQKRCKQSVIRTTNDCDYDYTEKQSRVHAGVKWYVFVIEAQWFTSQWSEKTTTWESHWLFGLVKQHNLVISDILVHYEKRLGWQWAR